MRTIIGRLTLIAAMVWSGIFLTANMAAAEKTVRIGLQPAPLLGFYIRDKQLLEKRGFKPEWTVLPASPAVAEAMVAEALDVAVLGAAPVLSTAMKNTGIWYFYDELANSMGMVVQADSDIQGPEDLKGRKLAFPGKGTQPYAGLLMYLEGSGVQVEDVDLIRTNAPDMTTLFKRKGVEGALVWPPFTSELVRNGDARALFNADDLFKQKNGHWLNAGWTARGKYAQENEDVILAVVEAVHEATEALRSNPEEVYAAIANGTGNSIEAIQYMIENKYVVYFDPADTVPSVENMSKIMEILQKYEIVTTDQDTAPAIEALVHPEFAEKVLSGN